MSLHKIQIDFENDCISKREDVSYLELTGCGIDINDQGLVASGDFSGNVYLWKPGERSPYGRFKAASSIRCTKWIGDYLVFGCLNSIVYCWKHVGNSVTHTTDANNSIQCLWRSCRNGTESFEKQNSAWDDYWISLCFQYQIYRWTVST